MIQRKNSSENCSPTIDERIKVMEYLRTKFGKDSQTFYMDGIATGLEYAIKLLTNDDYFQCMKRISEIDNDK